MGFQGREIAASPSGHLAMTIQLRGNPPRRWAVQLMRERSLYFCCKSSESSGESDKAMRVIREYSIVMPLVDFPHPEGL
jgi:hypothetical protein